MAALPPSCSWIGGSEQPLRRSFDVRRQLLGGHAADGRGREARTMPSMQGRESATRHAPRSRRPRSTRSASPRAAHAVGPATDDHNRRAAVPLRRVCRRRDRRPTRRRSASPLRCRGDRPRAVRVRRARSYGRVSPARDLGLGAGQFTLAHPRTVDRRRRRTTTIRWLPRRSRRSRS